MIKHKHCVLMLLVLNFGFYAVILEIGKEEIQ